MAHEFKTDQEEFWAGEFGDKYVERNDSVETVACNVALFSKMLASCPNANSLIEFGSNIGLNLRAISRLRPHMKLDAIEINESAVQKLGQWGGVNKIHCGSILDFCEPNTWDVSLLKGVLIHIDPKLLPKVYESLYRSSNRYILIAEYYNPTAVEVECRSHKGKLFKRDFAGEMLDIYPNMRMLDYGFVWRRDPVFPLDDLTWFVLEKADDIE